VDVGGGFGRQAVLLARAGHSVVVVDADPVLLAAAKELFAAEDPEVRRRLDIAEGLGEAAADLVGTGYDLVCCHSVLLYLADPDPMLASLSQLAGPGALVSVLTTNRDSLALRDALAGDWRGALATLRAETEQAAQYLPTRADRPDELGERLARFGVEPVTWYGVRAFADHQDLELSPEEFADLCELEWEAGKREPYRRFARLFHLVGRKLTQSRVSAL
jgi:SAM-dependent methyltransferase